MSFFGTLVRRQTGQPIGMFAGAAIIFFAYIGFCLDSLQKKHDSPRVMCQSESRLVICTVLILLFLPALEWSRLRHDKNAGVVKAFEHGIDLAGVTGITSVLPDDANRA